MVVILENNCHGTVNVIFNFFFYKNLCFQVTSFDTCYEILGILLFKLIKTDYMIVFSSFIFVGYINNMVWFFGLDRFDPLKNYFVILL